MQSVLTWLSRRRLILRDMHLDWYKLTTSGYERGRSEVPVEWVIVHGDA